MSLWKIFSGPSPEKLARKAEALVADAQWGPAKVALERALEKATDPELQAHLNAQIEACCDRLARQHLAQAEALAEAGHRPEAADLYRLAMEVARDPEIEDSARQGLGPLEAAAAAVEPELAYYSPSPGASPPGADDFQEDQATFWALIGTLPEDMQDAYEGYGEPFRSGYLALNSGDFELAAECLAEAHEDHPQAGTYIPLELAAAFAHLGRGDEAVDLLTEFLHYHPDILPAYQLLCDLLWEAENFEAVDDLLAGVPKDLLETVALVLLRGENFMRAGRLDAGIAFLDTVLDDFGWSDPVARLQAEICTQAGERDRARALYEELMQRCQSCHSRVDPMVKHNYAELSFADGQRDTRLLELYLSLTQEAPDRAAHYFRRVSAIYDAQGHREEAERFKALSERPLTR